MIKTYPVVCLCGSMRFKEKFDEIERELTKFGFIVVKPSVIENANCVEKAALDMLHYAKIDLANYVVVVNPEGYIGTSTALEIIYTAGSGKPIYALDCPKDVDYYINSAEAVRANLLLLAKGKQYSHIAAQLANHE